MSVIYRQIPNLGPAIALNGTEELEIVQAGVSLRSSVNLLATTIINRVFALPMPPTGAAGGDLTGSYPNPQILAGSEGQVLTTVGGDATWRSFATGGTVTSVDVATVNGFSGVVVSPTLAPVIGIRTTVTGLLLGDGQAVTAAVPGTDYVIPSGVPTTLPPSGPASGDLAGTYPAPTIKSSVALTGSPTTTTQTLGTSNTTIATTGFVTAAVAASPAGTVTSVSVVTANGLGGTVATATSTPAITLRTTISGLLKGDGTAISAAVAGTDYIAVGGTAGGDLSGTYPNPLIKPSVTNGQVLTTVGGVATWATPVASGGTVTSVSVVSANGLAGTVATATSTPAITLSTTITAPVLKGNGTAILAAVAGTDYVSPSGLTTALGSYLPLVGGTLTGPGNLAVGGTLGVTGALTGTTATWTGAEKVMSATAIPAGGTLGAGYMMSSTANFGVAFGSGAPDKAFARGSVYLRSDATAATGLYVNTDGTGAGWSTLGGGGGAATAVGPTPPGSPTDGQLWWYSDAVAGGGTMMIRYNDGSSTAWVPAAPSTVYSNTVLQTVSTQTGAVATGSTLIPLDDTLPQITEGNEYMTLAITPRSATSRLIIEVTFNGAHTVISSSAVALFQDATANALAVGFANNIANGAFNVKFTHNMTSGTTSATTFRVRAGGSAAGTTTFNGQSATRRYGGVMASSIVISEVV